MPAVTETLRRSGSAAAWLVAALLIAFGAAGIVAGTSAPPGTAARAELTWLADRAARQALDAGRADLTDLEGDLRRLATVARGAIAALTVSDLERLQAAIAEGDGIATSVEAAATAGWLRLEADAAFGPGAELRLSPATIAERKAMLAALVELDGLSRDWSSLVGGALAAARLTSVLLAHDAVVAEAATLGRADAWDDALAKLDVAAAVLAESVALRDEVAKTADVAILDEWIARNARYDAALRGLYEALRDSRGRVTDAVRAAFREETAAREQLPPDSRGLVLIVAELGRAGLNEAVIAIETRRGALTRALASLDTLAGTSPAP